MFRTKGHTLCLPLLILLVAAGCEDLELPFPAESDSTTESSAAPADATPDTPAPAEQPQPDPTPAPAPVAMTAQSVLDAIAAKPSMEVTDQDLQQFSRVEGGLDIVTELNLKGVKLTSAGLEVLAGLPALTKLDLESARIREGEWQGLSGATQLEWLGLKNAAVNDRSIAAIGGMKNLTYLDISDTLVTDEGFRHMIELASLEMLVANSLNFNGEGIQAFGKKGAKSPLRVIHAGNTTFGIRGFVHIKDFTELEELMLPNATVTDNSLVGLKRINSLVTVSLRNNNRVSDEGLKLLAKSRNLEFLDLNGINKISDATLRAFTKCKQLRELRINDSACSPQGVQKFKKSVPDCKVTLKNKEY